MAVTNMNADAARPPRWAEHGLFRETGRYEGPAETAKMLLSGRWNFTPLRLWEKTNAYSDELLAYVKEHHITILRLVWSPGFSHQADQVQWDILREYFRRAHRKGIKIVAYLSLTNSFWQEMFEAEPQASQWRQIHHDGGNVPYMAATYHGEVSRILLCVNNRGWRDYFKQKVRAALEAGADGLFFDNLFSKCYCPICREGFAQYTREVYGQAYDMPVPDAITQNELQKRTGIEVIADSDRNVAGERPFLHQARSDYWNRSTTDFLRELWDMARQIKPDVLFGHNAHERWPMNQVGNYKLSEDDKPCSYDPSSAAIWTNFGLWKYLLEDGGRHKPFLNGVKSKAEWAEINACGGDAIGVVDPAYHAFHKRFGRQIYHRTQPLGRVGVVLRGLSPVADRAPFFSHLARHNVQFDIVIYEQIDQYKLSLYDVLILFDVRAMGSETADRLGEYVRRGGNLIATGPTGIAKHNWQPREASCLADVLGIDGEAPTTGRVEHNFGKGHVVFYPESIGDKLKNGQIDEHRRQFIEDLRRLQGTPLIEVDAPDGVLATVMGKGRNKIIVHLINYRPEPVGSVQVRLPGCSFSQVTLLSPDEPKPTLDRVDARPDGLSFAVERLNVYAVALVSRS